MKIRALAGFARAVLCCVFLAMATAWFAALAAVGRPFCRTTAAWLKLRSFCFRSWSRIIARLTGMRIRVEGEPPSSPFILVSNHLSYLDIVVMSLNVDCAFVAKGEVARWPLIGWACRRIGTIFIRRETKGDLRQVLATMGQIRKDGLGVVLFPEGTTTPGVEVGPFRPSLLEGAAREQLPVHYAAISYHTSPGSEPAGQIVCWWGDIEFLPHLFRLFRAGGFEALLRFGHEPVRGADRKSLADELRHAVIAEFTPTS
jgi:1-acyl-sn-glycerol-3-phosphate acyltransferase